MALPNFNKAAVMALNPHTWDYVAEKLNLNEADARVVHGYLQAMALGRQPEPVTTG